MIGAAVWLSLACSASAQFGQNHVVVHDFDWKIRSTEHFDIYYYDGSAALVPEAAEILENAFKYDTASLDINVEPPSWVAPKEREKLKWRRRPFFLFASPNDFEQSNIAFVGDGTGGITEPFKDRFMVYNDGTYQWLDEVITHELTHVLQYSILVDQGPWRSGRILKTVVYPLWMMEGEPVANTYHIEPILEETTIRDAATSGGLISLTRLEHFGHLKPHQITLAYEEGGAAIQFVGEQFGHRKVGDMLRLFDTRLETSQVLSELLGLDAFQFDAKFREYAQRKYWHESKEKSLREPSAFGYPMTWTPDNIPQFNVSPVFSPDGRRMYYLTTSAGEFPPELRVMDLRTAKVSKLRVPWEPIENIPLGNFANLSRVLDITPDGRWLLWSGTRNHQDALFFYDLKTARLFKRELPGFQQISQPAFSPDGSQVVFSGMKDGTSDLYLYTLKDASLKRLTDDPRDEEMPIFTPDGRSIIFSGEVVTPFGHRTDERRLYRYDLADGATTRLEDIGGQSRDPVVSRDGKKVLFVLYRDGMSDLAELDLATGQARLLTRTIGGAYTPRYAADSEIAFSALRSGNVHIYKGARADFLDEPLNTAGSEITPGSEKFMLPGMGGVSPSTASAVALSAERPYAFDFSTDLILPAFFYSSPGGFYGTTYWQGSDMTGDHQATVLADVATGEYDYQAAYTYLRYRPQITVGAQGSGYHNYTDVDTGDTVSEDTNLQQVSVAYPIDRYQRLEMGLTSETDNFRDGTNPIYSYDDIGRTASVAYVYDTSRGRYLLVDRGNQFRVDFSQTQDVLGGNQRFNDFEVQDNRFFRVADQTALAFRGLFIESLGLDENIFSLGGQTAVRGYGYSESGPGTGNRFAMATADFRFPIVRELNYYMWYFFPDFYFKSLYGSLFDDVGYSWYSEGDVSSLQWNQLSNSVGLGLRIYTFILQNYSLIVSMDYAHRTTSNGGIFYVYLGQPF